MAHKPKHIRTRWKKGRLIKNKVHRRPIGKYVNILRRHTVREMHIGLTIRRNAVLCRSFTSKRWLRRMRRNRINKQFRMFLRKGYRKARRKRWKRLLRRRHRQKHLTPYMQRQLTSLFRVKAKRSRLRKGYGISGFSGLLVRIGGLRARRYLVRRHYYVRSNAYSPLLYLPYYVCRVPYSVDVVSNAFIHSIRTKLWGIICAVMASHDLHFIRRAVRSFFAITRMYERLCRSSAMFSRPFFFFRCVNLSLISFGGSFFLFGRNKFTYLQLLMENKFLVTKEQATGFQQRISNTYVFAWSLVSFFFKFFYIRYIYMFLRKYGFIGGGLFSESFFFFLLTFFISIRNNIHTFFSSILSSRNMRISFFKFILGSKYSRLSFFLFRLSSNFSIYYLLWFIQVYKGLFFAFFYRHVKGDVILLFLVSSTSHLFLSVLLKIATLFNYSRLFFLSINKILTCSFTIQYYVLFKYRLNASIYTVYSYFLSFILNFRLYRLQGGLLRFLKIKALRNLIYQIEYSLFSYNKVPHFFFAKYYYKSVPPITNAKMVCDSVLIPLSLGFNVKSVFSRILRWQKYWQRYYDDNTVLNLSRHGVNIGNFIYPLKGIRILCSGPSYKARRTTAFKYHLWVSDDFITGRMPLSFINLQIDYYQSVVVLRRSNIGLKVWLLFDAVL